MEQNFIFLQLSRKKVNFEDTPYKLEIAVIAKRFVRIVIELLIKPVLQKGNAC